MLSLNRIMKGIGGFYYVNTADGLVECKAKGIFRKRGISPLPGDIVTLETEGGGAVIADIAERKNVLVRPPVANLDVLFVVAATVKPAPNYLVLDKMCAIAQNKKIQPVIVATKTDLASADELCGVYEKSKIPVVFTNPDTEQGLCELESWINGRLCAFTGNSGVGKSTLLNRILPQQKLKTAEISEKLGRGRHTTRQVEFYPVCGGLVADTPGFSSLDMERANLILKDQLQYAFLEFEPYLGQCKFTGCSHRVEKGCAVRGAVDAGEIGRRRYESYLAMYENASSVKEWEIGR